MSTHVSTRVNTHVNAHDNTHVNTHVNTHAKTHVNAHVNTVRGAGPCYFDQQYWLPPLDLLKGARTCWLNKPSGQGHAPRASRWVRGPKEQQQCAVHVTPRTGQRWIWQHAQGRRVGGLFLFLFF